MTTKKPKQENKKQSTAGEQEQLGSRSSGRGSNPNSRAILDRSPIKRSLVPLAPGEVSVSVKIRGPEEAVAWFVGLEAVRRGELIRRIYAEHLQGGDRQADHGER